MFTIYIGDDTTDEDAFQVFLDQPLPPHAAVVEPMDGGGGSGVLDEESCHCPIPDAAAGSGPRAAAAGNEESTGSAHSGAHNSEGHNVRSRRGFGIVVTEERKSTWGAFTLRNPLEVAAFLQRLIQEGETGK